LLEFLVADDLSEGADTLVTGGARSQPLPDHARRRRDGRLQVPPGHPVLHG
jgi:hypothetical protein